MVARREIGSPSPSLPSACAQCDRPGPVSVKPPPPSTPSPTTAQPHNSLTSTTWRCRRSSPPSLPTTPSSTRRQPASRSPKSLRTEPDPRRLDHHPVNQLAPSKNLGPDCPRIMTLPRWGPGVLVHEVWRTVQYSYAFRDLRQLSAGIRPSQPCIRADQRDTQALSQLNIERVDQPQAFTS
jgi:hypothetical protein